MLGTWKTFAIVAALAKNIIAQELAVCDRTSAPNWKHCDQVREKLGWVVGNPDHYQACNSKNLCRVWGIENCAVSICWLSDDCLSATQGELSTDYRIIEQWCRPDDLGGYTYVHPDTVRLEIRYRPTTAVATGLPWSELVEEHYTLEEYNKIFHLGDTTNKRADTKWTNYLTQMGVTKPGVRYQTSQEVDSGAKVTWSKATEVSISVSVTAGVSASLFDIFSASMEISTTYEESHTISKAMEFSAGKCPYRAIVFWEPVFNKYSGAFSDDPHKTIEIWVARYLNGEPEGRLVTDCIGTPPHARAKPWKF